MQSKVGERREALLELPYEMSRYEMCEHDCERMNNAIDTLISAVREDERAKARGEIAASVRRWNQATVVRVFSSDEGAVQTLVEDLASDIEEGEHG